MISDAELKAWKEHAAKDSCHARVLALIAEVERLRIMVRLLDPKPDSQPEA